MPRPQPKKTPVLEMLTMDSDLSAEDRLKLTLYEGMPTKEIDLWRGTPQDLADRLLEFMKEEGFLQ